MITILEEEKKCEETISDITSSQIDKKIKNPPFPWVAFTLILIIIFIGFSLLYLSVNAGFGDGDLIKSLMLLTFSICLLSTGSLYFLKYIAPIIFPNTRKFKILDELPEF